MGGTANVTPDKDWRHWCKLASGCGRNFQAEPKIQQQITPEAPPDLELSGFGEQELESRTDTGLPPSCSTPGSAFPAFSPKSILLTLNSVSMIF